MSERGASPGPFEMPEVASWRKLQVWLRGVHRGLGASRWRRPNMRMKLTRRPSLCSGRSQSSLGAQLMRYPLGRPVTLQRRLEVNAASSESAVGAFGVGSRNTNELMFQVGAWSGGLQS